MEFLFHSLVEINTYVLDELKSRRMTLLQVTEW